MQGRTPPSPSLVYTALALCILLLFGIAASHSASPPAGKNIIVQHVYAIPTTGTGKLSVNLSLPVASGDLLVVGVVFGSVDTGSVSDTLANSFTGQQLNRSMVCYPCASNLGTGIWWATSRSSGNDTVNVQSSNSTELVEVFEIAGANASTIGLGSGGGWSPNPGINAVTAGQEVHDGTAFVLVVGGSADGNQSSVTCFPYGAIDNIPAQSPGFIIEPYCGTASPFTGGLMFGEYGIGNNTGEYICQPSGNSTTCSTTGTAFVEDLGVNPPLAGYSLGQAFWVDPTASASQSTTTTTVPSQSTATQPPTTTTGTTQPTTTTRLTTSIESTTTATAQSQSVSTELASSSTLSQSTSTQSSENGGTNTIVSNAPYIAAGVAAVLVAVGISVVLSRRHRGNVNAQ
jgi:hypothetical protein